MIISISNADSRTTVLQFYRLRTCYAQPHWASSHFLTLVKSCSSADRVRLRVEQRGMRCRVKSSRVTGWSGIECNCNGRRTRRTVAHSKLFAARPRHGGGGNIEGRACSEQSIVNYISGIVRWVSDRGWQWGAFPHGCDKNRTVYRTAANSRQLS